MSANRHKLLAISVLLFGIWVAIPSEDAQAISPGVVADLGKAEPGMSGAYRDFGTASVACANNASFNPDAGTGLLFGGAGTGICSQIGAATKIRVINDSATAVFISYRKGLTAGNYTTVGSKVCSTAATCPAFPTGVYETPDIEGINGNLFCVATGATPPVTIQCFK